MVTRAGTEIDRQGLRQKDAASREFVFWPDAVSPAAMPEVRSADTGKQITDRYLLGLARRHSGRLITFDCSLNATGGSDVVCLLTAG